MLYRQEPAIGFTVLNVLFIFSVIGYFFCGCHKTAGLLVNRVVMLAALNWLVNFPSAPFDCTAKIRYRHPGAAARVVAESDGTATVAFAEPVSAITPGQAVAFYDGTRVLGGGWIEKAVRE